MLRIEKIEKKSRRGRSNRLARKKQEGLLCPILLHYQKTKLCVKGISLWSGRYVKKGKKEGGEKRRGGKNLRHRTGLQKGNRLLRPRLPSAWVKGEVAELRPFPTFPPWRGKRKKKVCANVLLSMQAQILRPEQNKKGKKRMKEAGIDKRCEMEKRNKQHFDMEGVLSRIA